ncbi:HAD-IC family P-type ATPase [Chitinispirillales bacterium ANBcel5]|uniref:cation-translocating P-type ATPase n=1 Tax=Cellulosispirillum alkaliphilum TaxID=3039283 RepID=UPI002A523CEE|nr:HAD-IC family P-type ATPase [Chitinispirillales bacterium ANBcel5]
MHYRKDVKQVFEELESKDSGISNQEAQKRLQQHGPNELEKAEGESPYQLVLRQLKNPLIFVLIIAAIITLLIGFYVDMVVILAVVVINTVIGFIQEYKADKAMQALMSLSAPKAYVTREGKNEKIESSQVVPGDVIELMAGNTVPADARVFDHKELEVDESMLTGESVPVAKNSEPIDDDSVPLGDQANMVFMGTVATQGRGRAVVVKTGKQTELGSISEKVGSTEKQQTPLQKRLFILTWIIGASSVGLALLAFLVGILQGREVVDMLLFSISMTVAVIPEGLPVAITVTMAIGLTRMAKRNAIVRKLMAVETLGSCNYICSDKTGTITENRMTVTKVFAKDRYFQFKGTGYEPEGEILQSGEKVGDNEDLKKLLLCGMLCNTANLFEEEGEWKIDGDPTEGALIVSARKYGLGVEQEEQFEFVDEIPFSSQRKYMSSVFNYQGKCFIMVKGSPEKILKFTGNGDNKKLAEKYTELADDGLRVLGFCMKELPQKCPENIDIEKESTTDMEFLGFQGIIDPPRESAIEAIRQAHRAGIRVVMITGDHKVTASAIARRINILEEGDLVISGSEIDKNGKEFLAKNVEKTTVYARVSPQHKIDIVEELQKKGKVVAVTGDGVNDAPALKRGNIGVAMGEVGTDVAREASEMVLSDDNFATIFQAVKVGRVIFDNIRKVSFFLIATGAGIAVTILGSLFFGLQLPFLATQVLWMNLVTNSFQHLALANEPGEKDIHLRKPRDPGENVINAEVLRRIIVIAVFIAIGSLYIFWQRIEAGFGIEYARSSALNTIVFFQFFHAWNSRSLNKSVFKIPFFSNPYLFLSLLAAILAQVAVLHLSFMQFVFRTTGLGLRSWAETVGIGLLIIVVMEIDKLIKNIMVKRRGGEVT